MESEDDNRPLIEEDDSEEAQPQFALEFTEQNIFTDLEYDQVILK